MLFRNEKEDHLIVLINRGSVYEEGYGQPPVSSDVSIGLRCTYPLNGVMFYATHLDDIN